MTPITLFDKSFVQSLNLDESLFFDNFFMTVVCPSLHVETLADLEKAVRAGRTPEQEVGFIADKMPDIHPAVCANHYMICVNSLLGRQTAMDGGIPRAFGRQVRVRGKRGIVYEPSAEEEAYQRWQHREFLDVERRFAKIWRGNLNSDISGIAEALQAMGVKPKDCKKLEDVKAMAESFVKSTDTPPDRLNLARIVLGLPVDLEDSMYEHWKAAGFPPLTEHAPYAAYAFTVALFFHIAVGAKLLARTDLMDISYLFYLPFCTLFVSSDRLHQRAAPLFMRPNQEFVWGQDLKQNLRLFVEHYLKLPEAEREKGIFKLAPFPPEEIRGIVASLYDRHCGANWRDILNEPKREKRPHAALVNEIRQLNEAPEIPDEEIDQDEEIAMVKIERMMRRRRGSFYQVPKDMENAPI